MVRLAGEPFYWHARRKEAMWTPPEHATESVKRWEAAHDLVSTATLSGLTRRHRKVVSGEAARELKLLNERRRRRDARRAAENKAKESKARKHVVTLGQHVKHLAWVAHLTKEAEHRLNTYVASVQAQWRGIMVRKYFRALKEKERALKLQRREVEMKKALTIQRVLRGFLSRRSIDQVLMAPFAIYFMMGQPGSGKTTLGTKLAAKHNMIFVSVGQLFREEVKKPVSERLPGLSEVRICDS